jgi:hypothetical protein
MYLEYIAGPHKGSRQVIKIQEHAPLNYWAADDEFCSLAPIQVNAEDPICCSLGYFNSKIIAAPWTWEELCRYTATRGTS